MNDGGHHAIKGFAYQFDKSILEILNNPSAEVVMEHVQDLQVNSTYVQIKHLDASNYYPSNITRAVISILQDAWQQRELTPDASYILYCYFKDKVEGEVLTFTPQEFKTFLPEATPKYEDAFRDNFANSFKVIFGPNYNDQYMQTLNVIGDKFLLQLDVEKEACYAILYAGLLETALKDNPVDRKLTFAGLSNMYANAESAIYLAHLRNATEKDAYLKQVKKDFFTPNKSRLDAHDKLFILESKQMNEVQISTVISAVVAKYYRDGKSHAPHIVLRNIDPDKRKQVKLLLKRAKVKFIDGTQFQDDEFDLDYYMIANL